jgi:transcriptional regulator with XRE-family HTH domain
MDTQDKNEGPIFLEAWRSKAGMSQAELGAAANTTQGMIAHLESDRRGLSAKWLRRLAPLLNTTPGMLLDHHPDELSADLYYKGLWDKIGEADRPRVIAILEAFASDKK